MIKPFISDKSNRKKWYSARSSNLYSQGFLSWKREKSDRAYQTLSNSERQNLFRTVREKTK